MNEMNNLLWVIYWGSFIWIPATAGWSWWRALLSIIVGTIVALDADKVGEVWQYILMSNFLVFTLTTVEGWVALAGLFAVNKMRN